MTKRFVVTLAALVLMGARAACAQTFPVRAGHIKPE
jgi:hypothetical protein